MIYEECEESIPLELFCEMERNGEMESSAPWWPETGGRNEDD